MKVTDPTGQTWRVSRRWVPWRRRLTGWIGESTGLDGLGDDVLSAIILVVVGIPVLVVVALAFAELLLLLLLLPFALLGRVLLGRRWTVTVRRDLEPWWDQPVGSWADTRVKIAEVATAIQHGHVPPRTIDVPGTPDAPRAP